MNMAFEISDYYPSITVKTNESPKERSDDEFQSLAIEIVNDILLVSSMVAGRWIDWFSWEFYSSDKHGVSCPVIRKGLR